MEKKKMNDKGFSLVELIIVIAIMAILIAVLAPQYLKFVERSRKSADRDTVDQVIRAVQIDFADPESALDADGATLTIKNSGDAVAGGTNATNLTNILKNAGIDLADIKLKSSKWHDGDGGAAVTQIVIKFSSTGEAVTATVTAGTGTNPAVDDNHTTITGKSVTATP